MLVLPKPLVPGLLLHEERLAKFDLMFTEERGDRE